MLKPGDDDLVVFLNVAPSPALRYQVDAFGCAANEDDLAGRRRIEKAPYLLPRRLIRIGGASGELVRCAMYVGVFMFVEIRESIDHALRLLRRRRVIKPNQRPAVHALAQ